MKKVVVNRCFGGFGLSIAAAKFMAQRGNEEAKKELKDYTTSEHIYEKYTADEIKKHDKHWFGHFSDMDRSDPLLIAVVEALGEKANGADAELEIVEIPDDVEYTINDYDGQETIHEQHRSW